MRKIQKFILAIVLVAIMLISSAPAIALAQEDGTPERRGALISQVADILGIDQQELENALKQAQMELREETLDTRLQELIADGTLTQEQANELESWINARPDVPNIPPRQLKKALENGTITQEQIDQLKAWLKSRPDIPKIQPEPRKERLENIQERRDALTTRVAEILGISKADLENAFKQAQSGFREQALDTRLQELVNQGAWTQQQADAFKAWIEARPDVPPLRLNQQSGPSGS
jgi:DNA-binding HxlR family transcriptional regulator